MSDDLEQYTGYVNQDYTGKFDASTNILQDIAGGVGAAVVDFGTSVFNSLVPEKYETSTEDILRRVSDNALRVYNEHPDAVHTASFVGGMFVPSGLALKGMNMLRNGAKGVSWFSTERRAADLTQLEELMRQGPAGTKAYKALRNEVFLKGVANQSLDAVAMELAVLGSMSAHPFMEDYVKDPVKNFAISATLGGVIGSGIGHIADRFAVKAIEGGVQAEAFKSVLEPLKNITEGMPSANSLQVYQSNIDHLTSMLAQQGPESGAATAGMNGLAKHYAEQVLEFQKVEQKQEFNSMAKRLLDNTPEEFHGDLQKLITDKFTNIDAVRGLQLNEKKLANGSTLVTLDEDFGPVSKTVKKMVDGMEVEAERAVSRVYFPEANGWGTAADASHIGRATALKGVNEKSIQAGKSFDKGSIQVPNNDRSLEVFKKIAPSVDNAYLEELMYIDKLDVNQLAKAAIAPDDLPRLNGLVARIVKEKEAGNTSFANVQVKLTKMEPRYDQAFEAKVVAGTGVQPDYFQVLGKAVKEDLGKYNLTSGALSPRASSMIRDWVQASKGRDMASSGMQKLRDAMQSYMRPSQYVTPHVDTGVAKELYESAQSTAFRAQLSKIADAEGNVYLYRGMHQEARGSSALESFAATSTKGGEHGNVRLYKVNVKEVVGVIRDMAGNNKSDNIEILVSSATRKHEARLPILGDTVKASQVAAHKVSEVSSSMQDVVAAAVDAKESLIRSMSQQGLDHLEIAIRTNTPKEAVQGWIMEGMPSGRLAIGDNGVRNIWEYGAASQLKEYLSPMKAPLLARTNLRKSPWVQMQANMDSLTLNRAAAQITEDFFTQGANSIPMVGEFHNVMYGPGMSQVLDIMRAEATQASNGNSGVRFVNSADHYARKMKNFGVAATHLGKEIEGVANRTIERMLVPVRNTFSQITRDVVLQNEFNTAIKFNAQLKSYRIYKDRQFWQKQEVLGADGVPTTKLVPALFQGQEYRVVSDAVDELLTHLQGVGREIYSAKNLTNKILGRPALHDIGFWTPALNPRDKHIAYVWNKVDNTTQILWGNNADELSEAIAAYKPTVAQSLLDGSIEIVPKGRQEGLNILNNRDDPMTMTIANVEKFHSGASSPVIVKANADTVAEIVGGLEHTVQNHVRQMAEISLYDISDNLQRMSKINTELSRAQPLGKLMQAINKPKDAAKEMRNIMLGLKDLPDYTSWQDVNSGFEGVMGWGLNKVSEIWKTVSTPAKGFLKKKGPMDIDYETFAKKMDEAGVVNPYAVFGEQAAATWDVAKLQGNKNQAARLIYASNAFAATAALRFGDIAQPLVNAMSYPILAAAAIAEKAPKDFMGVARSSAKITLAGAMHDGIRAMHSQSFEHLGERWAKSGYFDPVVSEASKVLKLPREFQPGPVASTERFLDSNFVNLLSKGADYSESLIRKTAMYTGAMIAKKLYPDLGEAGITIYARNFMDRTVGNYHAAQRPVFFQGTLGTAMGLFQTYMLTYAQTMYRQLELKDYKALGKMMLAQSTIFGAGSLPGFHPISEMIGEHYSDDHTDLQSGVVRAVPDTMAKAILYGLPSSIGPAFYTRGELAPRISTPANLAALPTVNMLGQVLSSVGKVASAAAADGEDVPRALGEALSLQSVSRPLARVSEILTGYSVTSKGNTVESMGEVWTTTGVISRLLSTRPTEEAMLRETNHLSTLYGSLDREARGKVVSRLKTAIRSDNLDPDKLEQWALDYMDNGGTPTGWRSAVRTAIGTTEISMSGPLREKLHDNSSLNHMLDMLDD